MKKIAVAVAIHGKQALIRYIQFPDNLRGEGVLIEGPENQPLTSLESVGYPELVSKGSSYLPGTTKAKDNKLLVMDYHNPRAFIASLGLLIRMANWRYKLSKEPGPEELKLVPKGFFVIS